MGRQRRLHKWPVFKELATWWSEYKFYSTRRAFGVFLAIARIAHTNYGRAIGVTLPMISEDYDDVARRWQREFEDEYTLGNVK